MNNNPYEETSQNKNVVTVCFPLIDYAEAANKIAALTGRAPDEIKKKIMSADPATCNLVNIVMGESTK